MTYGLKNSRQEKTDADWILPADYDHASSEAKHLISESDVDHVSIFFKNNTKNI